jgi:2-methylcitrate dehydratase PrpD
MAITTRDGRRLEGALDFPRGDPENRLPDEALRAKFRALAGAVFDADGLARIEAAVAAFADDGPRPLAAAVAHPRG